MADVDITVSEGLRFTESVSASVQRVVIIAEGLRFTEVITAQMDPWLTQSDITLPAFTCEGVGLTGFIGEADFDIPYFGLEGEGYGNEIGEANITLPIFEMTGQLLAGMVASGELDLPPPTLVASGLTGLVGEGDLTLPIFVVDGNEVSPNGGELPIFEIEAEGETGWVGTASLELPKLQIAGEGYGEQVGVANLILPMLTLSASDMLGTVGQADLILPALRLTANGLTGEVGQADLTLPALSADGDGYPTEIQGTASLILPMFIVEGYGEISPSGQTVQNVVVMNLSNYAISEYSNYGFTDYFIFQGNYYGVKPDGIYLLEGTTDQGIKIDMEVEKIGIDLNSPLLKRMTDAYLKFRATGDLLVKMIADKKSHPYILNNGIEGLRTQKIDIGKGMKGRHLGFNLQNIQGAHVRFNELILLIETLKRHAHDGG